MHIVQQPQAFSESRRMPSEAEIRQRLAAAYSVHRSWGLRLIGMASSVFVGVSVAWALAQLLETSLLPTMALIVPLAFIPDLILWRRSTRREDQVTNGEVEGARSRASSCTECGAVVFDFDPACPECGRGRWWAVRKEVWILVGVSLFVAVSLLLLQ
jgi:hypothetical protein